MQRRIRMAALLALFFVSSQAFAQSKDSYLRTNPKFKAAFAEICAPVSKSTVRILCDGSETALGVIVGKSGWVLTKAADLHGKITCKLHDGRVLAAKRAGVHERHDLAVLRIDADGLTPVLFADSNDTGVGSWVACPGVGSFPVAFGIISVAARNVPNGGGPILATNPGYLGIGLEAGEAGVRITQVTPKTPAAEAGLKENDTILRLLEDKVTDPQEFIGRMQKFHPGDIVTLKIRRGGEEHDIKATLTKKPRSRSDIQNSMGSKLSSRRSGYPAILQFDGVILPTDCGGPVVNLDGKVVGLTISRAGRPENWAVPSEAIRPVLLDLMYQHQARDSQRRERK